MPEPEHTVLKDETRVPWAPDDTDHAIAAAYLDHVSAPSDEWVKRGRTRPEDATAEDAAAGYLCTDRLGMGVRDALLRQVSDAANTSAQAAQAYYSAVQSLAAARIRWEYAERAKAEGMAALAAYPPPPDARS